MKKYTGILLPGERFRYARFPLTFLHVIALVFTLLSVIPVRGQPGASKKIDIDVHNLPLKQALEVLQKKSSYNLIFNNELVASFKVSVKARGQSVEAVLTALLKNTDLEYLFKGNNIIIRKKAPAETREAAPKSVKMTVMSTAGTPSRLKGKVLATDDEPLPGVTVMVKDSPQLITQTNINGEYSLTVPDGDHVVVFRYVGFKTREVKISKAQDLNVTLEVEDNNLESVVVTGVFTRKAESFTGAASTYTAEQLRMVGNQNVFQSLKVLDPSFIQVENITAGSDPNTLPDLQIRGGNSLPGLKGEYSNNPNMPLFILDGFETNLQKIYDLDVNRVASVTILKDAAAKAIYGSRAANGVVVVETKRPEMGKLRVSYTADFNVSDPDLSSYRLTDAREKLQVELDAGRFTTTANYADQDLKEQYNDIYSEIARGVNTYWLDMPLRTAAGHKHTLSLEGGDPFLRYGADLTYNDQAGAMKESGRKTISGNVFLSYRLKDFLFRNTLMVTGNDAYDSPYGAFSAYSRLNPYWTPYEVNGTVKKLLGQFSPVSGPTVSYFNPLYNASLGTKNFSKYTDITNNFQTEWSVNKSLKLIGRLGYTQKMDTREDFYPANHTRYAEYSEADFFRRGDYSITDGKDVSIKSDLTLNYSKLLGKHLFFVNTGWNLYETGRQTHGLQAQGFLNDRVDYINFAKQYQQDGRPLGSDAKTRETGLLFALNYSYDDRYLADVTFRRQGSSVFGADNRWGSFWSAGIGWNIHKEHFLEDARWIDQLKLRASTGYTGSQNFNPYQAMATYEYFTDTYYDNIVGAKLIGLANKELKWQQTQDYNFGLDLQFLKHLTVRADHYISTTSNLLTDLPLPGSSGFSSIKENLGQVRNKGWDVVASYSVFNNPGSNSFLNVFANLNFNKNKLLKISDALNSINDEREAERGTSTKPFTRYREGESTTAIWAVPSLGIDPVNGEEIFVAADGSLTYKWNANDQVVVGDSNPKARGSFGFNGQYKGWGINCSFSYRLGGQYYNQTLVDRVENVDIQYNVDRRVFTSTWKQPGDQVFFKKISNSPTRTNPTSRFVQDLSELQLVSANLSYDFRDTKFIKRMGMQRLRLTLFANDIARVASVKAERGLDYPFTRNYSCSLQATF